MKKYYHKLILFMLVALAAVCGIWLVNSGTLVKNRENNTAGLNLALEAVNAAAPAELLASRQNLLVLYSPQMEDSVKYADNVKKAAHHLKMDCDLVETGRRDTVSFQDYDVIFIATSQFEEEIGVPGAELIMNYVKNGGRLLIGVVPEGLGEAFSVIYRKLGILEYGDYRTVDHFEYKEELVPGMKQMQFGGEGFGDTALYVRLDSDSRVYMECWNQEETEKKSPMFWTSGYGKGRAGFFNGTAMSGDFWSGMAAGSIVSLYDYYLYPVTNAKTVFIDDFPSPQYNNESEVTKAEYNRTVKEFYRDIWWPDMQAAATMYRCGYTGLFVATYNDIVEPDRFEYDLDRLEQYYGNSLMKNDYEIGAHGYNHQSLGLQGQIPKKLGYRPWASVEDMTASIRELDEISKELFPETTLQVYVPPSNYLSPEGRRAVAAALPDLKMISGVYTMEGEEGAVYVQDFRIAEDGIVEYPRISSGMLNKQYDQFAIMNGLGLYGIFSHFVHPDDIFDEERGDGKNWEQLFDGFGDILHMVNERYQGLRPLTASQAADALTVAEKLEIAMTVEGDRVVGKASGFYGESYCCFKSRQTPFADNDSCEVTPVSYSYGGEYYLVKIMKPEFSFHLEEGS